jgi:hypothetical protein
MDLHRGVDPRRRLSLGNAEDVQLLGRRLATRQRPEGNPSGGLSVAAAGRLVRETVVGTQMEPAVVDHLDRRFGQGGLHFNLGLG